MRQKIYYAGFVGGCLATLLLDDQFGGKNLRLAPAIFLTRKEARAQYQDVRKILICDVREILAAGRGNERHEAAKLVAGLAAT